MNESLDRLFLHERINRFSESSLNKIEHKLKEFEADLQSAKNEALKNQQLVSDRRMMLIVSPLRSSIRHFVNSPHIRTAWSN